MYLAYTRTTCTGRSHLLVVACLRYRSSAVSDIHAHRCRGCYVLRKIFEASVVSGGFHIGRDLMSCGVAQRRLLLSFLATPVLWRRLRVTQRRFAGPDSRSAQEPGTCWEAEMVFVILLRMHFTSGHVCCSSSTDLFVHGRCWDHVSRIRPCQDLAQRGTLDKFKRLHAEWAGQQNCALRLYM